jgi:hypothetical protein
MSIIARNFEPKTKPNGDQTVGTATLYPIYKHNNKDCNYGDIACDAVITLDTYSEGN